jgi:hypothetical protein
MPTDGREFSLSYDRTAKIISSLVLALLVVLCVSLQTPVVIGISVAIAVVAYAYAPRSYAISEGAIVVRRLAGSVRFPLKSIREARLAAADDLRGTLKVWGSGGLFGYYGLYRTSKLGRSSWYVTDRSKMVVLVTDGKTALLSPGDPDGFLAAVRAEAPGAASGPGPGEPAPTRSAWRSPATWIGIAIGAASLALVARALTYSPGPPRFDLTSSELTILDRFYPAVVAAANVDFARIRVVDIKSDAEWRPTRRTNGFSNSHYHSGWFRTANGQKAEMYWADGSRLVLLPPKTSGAAPVLLEVSRPEQFIERLRQEWAR